MKKQSQNFIIAVLFIVSIMALLFVIVLNRIGGDEAIFLIIGHMAAWIEIIVIFYFRKKPPADNLAPGPTPPPDAGSPPGDAA